MRSARVVFGFLLWSASVAAQQYVISTYAGGALLPTPALGLDLPIGAASGVASDAAGNIYFLSADSVFKLDPSGALTRVAGNSSRGYSEDGGPATNAQLRLGLLAGVAVDNSGNLFLSDFGNHCIRRVSSSGTITTVAGKGTRGFSGDGGPATDAQLADPTGLAVDRAGNLFLSDYGSRRIRKVFPSGIITTVAGTGSDGFSGDGGPATSAQLMGDTGVAVDDALNTA